jgi:hypothetical protein
VMLTNYDGAMRLVSWHTLRAQRTTSAMVTPLEAVNDLASGLVNATALGALKTPGQRAARVAILISKASIR